MISHFDSTLLLLDLLCNFCRERLNYSDIKEEKDEETAKERIRRMKERDHLDGTR